MIDPYENVLKHLLEVQTEEGYWESGGQSDNRPEISTGWAVLALEAREEFMAYDGPGKDPRREVGPGLRRIMEPNDKPLPKSREGALAWLKSTEPGKPDDLNERLVLRVLVEHKFGEPADAKRRLKELLKRQNGDGGWSAMPKLGRNRDAFATGHSLYALNLTGLREEVEALERSRKFLLEAQQPDGSWHVSTLSFHPLTGESEHGEATEQVYTYWGTAWATLGLLNTLPVSSEGDDHGKTHPKAEGRPSAGVAPGSS